jgi:hypothetical protein
MLAVNRAPGALATRRADAVAGAEATAATHASLTAPGSTEVVDPADVLAIANRLQLIAERAACAAGTTGTTCRAFRAGFHELAELPEYAKLAVEQLIALVVLGGAARRRLTLGLAHLERAVVLTCARQARTPADRGVGARRAVGDRSVQEPDVEVFPHAPALKRRLGTSRGAPTRRCCDRQQEDPQNEHKTGHASDSTARRDRCIGIARHELFLIREAG